jgi:type IV pilus assembly protein PilE
MQRVIEYKRTTKNKGVTIVELTVALAVAAILSALVWPSYRATLSAGNMKVAQSHMIAFCLKQQRYWLEQRRYADESELLLPNVRDYEFTFTQQDAALFLLTATKKTKSQTQGDQCAVLNIDQSMNRKPHHCWP